MELWTGSFGSSITTTNSTTNTTNTTKTALVVDDVLPQLRFDVCWLEGLNSGQHWTKLIGCAIIIYTWCLNSQRKSLWNVLLVHALSGLLGTLVENVWVGAANCRLFVPKSANSPYAWLPLVNEINWIPHDAAIVVYSYIKTRIVIRNKRVERAVAYFLVALGLLYVACRLNIGRLRFQHNALSDDDIALAHNYVWILWFIADAVLFVLLFWNVADRVRSDGDRQPAFIVQTLLSSSLPRFAVIFSNTLALAVLNFALRAPNLSQAASLTLKNFSKFASLVKGTYPVLLLLDVLMTRFLLFARHAELTAPAIAGRSAGSGNGGRGGSLMRYAPRSSSTRSATNTTSSSSINGPPRGSFSSSSSSSVMSHSTLINYHKELPPVPSSSSPVNSPASAHHGAASAPPWFLAAAAASQQAPGTAANTAPGVIPQAVTAADRTFVRQQQQQPVHAAQARTFF